MKTKQFMKAKLFWSKHFFFQNTKHNTKLQGIQPEVVAFPSLQACHFHLSVSRLSCSDPCSLSMLGSRRGEETKREGQEIGGVVVDT